jgi:hemolysin D
MLRRQWREYEDRVDVLLHERQKNQAARASAQTQVDKLNAVFPIVSRKADSQKGLAAKKLLSEQQYLSAEQERREMYHELLAGKGRVEELAAAVATLDARVEHARSEFHSGVLERLDDAERRYSVALQELVKASVRAKANTITSPVDGVVQQLAVHSPGTVVTPAQDLMVIVPEGDALEVEALLENKDIGFVEPGQQAEIKVDAFPFTRYGTIDGKVENLSRDAVADERKGLVYKMRVQMSQSSIRVNERQVALSPGMTVTVESKTGTRRLIEFFLSPLLRYRDEGLRER